MRFESAVAIVTGAGRNIGEAIALAFAAEGARVAVVDLDPGRARAVAGAIEADHPGVALAVACDVSDEGAVDAMVRHVVERWGGIDILVNNVAVTDRRPMLELDGEEWDRVFRVTVKSVFLCSRRVAAWMVESGRRGTIVNLGSTSGHLGRSSATAYPAAKAAVLNLTRSLALQLAPHGIRVNSVSPNRVGSPVGQAEERTDAQVRNLVGRRGRPTDVARAVLFLAGEEGSFVDGADLLVDGGALAMHEP